MTAIPNDAEHGMVSSCSCCASSEDLFVLPAKEREPLPRHNRNRKGSKIRRIPPEYRLPILSFIMLFGGIVADHIWQPIFFKGYWRLIWYVAAYLPVGLPVLTKALRAARRGRVFTEFLLMSIAALGAFAIRQYPEAVAVLLFYCVGELFQEAAVARSKRNIKALLDMRPESVRVRRQSRWEEHAPSAVGIGEIIQVKPGERVALDGVLLSERSDFDTAALTGESKPDNKHQGDTVLAGMITLHTVAEIKVMARFKDTQLSRILQLVQEATQHKAKPELFVSRFAKYYTPIVVFLAIGLCGLPYFFVRDYIFNEWLYRALVFLVVSCPCALVVSIPLGYFGGIGLASRKGILFKGANFLDLITRLDTVVWDKTGTLTKGVFKVQKVEAKEFDPTKIVQLAGALESRSTHPVALAIAAYAGEATKGVRVTGVEEIPGHGMKGVVDGYALLVGNRKLFERHQVDIPEDLFKGDTARIGVAISGQMAGYIVVADELKEDAQPAIAGLKALGLKTVMLSGDKTSISVQTARQLGLDEAYGDLLPADKMAALQTRKAAGEVVGFVGDGINDAPVIAIADIGIAMGGLGSDAAIETADIVIQSDLPSRIITAIRIGKRTRNIVWQNIVLALGVKLIVLFLGAEGSATLWEAVFADVGVAMLAILNAVRLLRQRHI